MYMDENSSNRPTKEYGNIFQLCLFERLGRNFNLTEKFGFCIEAGIDLPFYQSHPGYYDFDQIIYPSAEISIFYKINLTH